MRTLGNLILMALVCFAVFIVFMAIRPSPAHAGTFYAASFLRMPAIVASRVGSYSCVGVRCSWWPKTSVHIHGSYRRGVHLENTAHDKNR